MISDDYLFSYLPSNQQDFLAQAIGRHLIEIERYFTLDPSSFLEDKRFIETDYFIHNSGPIQFRFEDDLMHVLDIWGEQLSVIVMHEPLNSDEFGTLYRLTEFELVSPDLKTCLGRRCQDVRIWTLQEDFESEEAKEVAVSYTFAPDLELFYCIYLHDDLDSDYLLLGQDVPREKVATCLSLAQEAYVDPGK